jgi:NAD(P)-dependent dehydrogenase (short-subunit alcohol dehydrogenase family)
MLNQHVWMSFNFAQAFVPYLIKNGWEPVIMVLSPIASIPFPKSGAYAIGKSGQEALILTLAQELKDTGVTANLLQVRSTDFKREKISALSSDNAYKTTSEELVGAILYIISDDAGAINGARIPLYGSN